MDREKANHAVVTLCRVLGVSPSGSWAWRKRGPAARSQADAHLSGQIRTIYQASRATYGVPRIHAALASAGTPCGRKRVARPHRVVTASWGAIGGGACRPTQRGLRAEPAPDLVQRTFAASAPNALWIADITYVPTCYEGLLSLAVILDVFSRRVVRWAMAEHLRTELAGSRAGDGGLEPAPRRGRHSSLRPWLPVHRAAVRRALPGGRHPLLDGVRRRLLVSHAMAERFFATLECELLVRQTFHTLLEARTALFESIEVFYNRQRRQSALDYLSPDDYESNCLDSQALTSAVAGGKARGLHDAGWR